MLPQEDNTQNSIKTITIAVASADDLLSGATDYSYSLSATAGSDQVAATAASPFGVAYALETLLQLASADGTLPCGGGLSITDAPEYVHRGLMIDTGR